MPARAVPIVMVVEDEPIVAQDIIFTLEDAGYQCLGPFRSVKSALDELERSSPDFALLDVNLIDGQVFPVADVLAERGTPFAFCSAHLPQSEGEDRYPGTTVIGKPFMVKDLIRAVDPAQ